MARERRTHFVRDVTEESLLAGGEPLEPLAERVDLSAELAEFVATPRVHPHIEPPVRDLRGGGGHLRHGARDAVR